MEVSKGRKSWLDLLEETGEETKESSAAKVKKEPLDGTAEQTCQVKPPKDELAPMEVDDVIIKTESQNDPVQRETNVDSASKVKSEPDDELEFSGAESGWTKLVEESKDDDSTLTPGKFTFAQICAKNSPAASLPRAEPEEEDSNSKDSSSGLSSPEKRERKRSLFPDKTKREESFGILDEQSMDSPCKDIRDIMTNIHMDSPLKQDENEDTTGVRRSSPRKAVVLKSRDLREALRSPNKASANRKRTRETGRSHESPAPKMPHVSTSPPNKKTPRHKPRAPKLQYETDKETLSRRQKQLEYGKNTIGYQRYVKLVSKESREKRHPKTPPKHLRYSRRAWDGLVKVWRQKLHFWDPPKDGEQTPTELPESWDNLSEFSASISDTTSERSERSVPNTPQSERRRAFSHSDSEEVSVPYESKEDIAC